MKERPILFSGPMVQALLAGTKTQTRRVVTPQPRFGQVLHNILLDGDDCHVCPHGAKGDRLWVRETHQWDNDEYVQRYIEQPWLGDPDPESAEVHYRASEPHPDIFPRWSPSIFMPRWACRLKLEITKVRAQRVQEISQWDCVDEGLQPGTEDQPDLVEKYRVLWDSLNAKRGYGWAKNPWVWVIEFRRVAE